MLVVAEEEAVSADPIIGHTLKIESLLLGCPLHLRN